VEGQDLSRKYFATQAKQLPGLAKLALFVSTGQRLTQPVTRIVWYLSKNVLAL
jgi:hypothetical protein